MFLNVGNFLFSSQNQHSGILEGERGNILDCLAPLFQLASTPTECFANYFEPNKGKLVLVLCNQRTLSEIRYHL